MTETVKVKIGGEEIALPLIMVFSELKRTDPARRAFADAEYETEQIAAGLAFIAALLAPVRPELTLSALESRLRVQRYDPATDADEVALDERAGVRTAVLEVLKESGLIPRKPPELPAAARQPNPSTATGITSSPN